MDTLTEKEFMALFNRVSKYVNLKGAFTAEEILKRMKASKAWKKPPKKYSRLRKKWVKLKGDMKRLATYGFQDRAAGEFRKAKPDSLLRLTFLWGREKALEIRKIITQRKIGRLRRPPKRPRVTPVRREAERERIERVMIGLRRREEIYKKRRWWRR